MIFDSHSHYDDEAFDADRDELLLSLNEKNIGHVVAAAAGWDSFDLMIKMCQKYDFMHLTLGIHPNNALELTLDHRRELEELLKTQKVVAVGEIGLDYHYDEPAPEIQKEAFIYQLKLAQENDLPVIIHSRDATQDTLDIMKEFGPPQKGVIHCFSSSKEIAAEYVKMGYYIGVGGVVTFKNSKTLKEVVTSTPIENILLETDCPYLAPTPFRGERNSSALLPYVVEEIARLKNMSEEEVIDITERNAKKLFNID